MTQEANTRLSALLTHQRGAVATARSMCAALQQKSDSKQLVDKVKQSTETLTRGISEREAEILRRVGGDLQKTALGRFDALIAAARNPKAAGEMQERMLEVTREMVARAQREVENGTEEATKALGEHAAREAETAGLRGLIDTGIQRQLQRLDEFQVTLTEDHAAATQQVHATLATRIGAIEKDLSQIVAQEAEKASRESVSELQDRARATRRNVEEAVSQVKPTAPFLAATRRTEQQAVQAAIQAATSSTPTSATAVVAPPAPSPMIVPAAQERAAPTVVAAPPGPAVLEAAPGGMQRFVRLIRTPESINQCVEELNNFDSEPDKGGGALRWFRTFVSGDDHYRAREGGMCRGLKSSNALALLRDAGLGMFYKTEDKLMVVRWLNATSSALTAKQDETVSSQDVKQNCGFAVSLLERESFDGGYQPVVNEIIARLKAL